MSNKLKSLAAKAKHVIVILVGVFTSLSASQRKAVYKVATAAGVAISVKFGVDADSAATWIATAGVFVSTVLVPLFAHAKTSD